MHMIAALRGDGLRPELAGAMNKRGTCRDGNACSPSYDAAITSRLGVVQLDRESQHSQSGNEIQKPLCY